MINRMFSDMPVYCIVLLVLFVLFALVCAKTSGHAVKSLILSVVGGLSALCAVGVLGQFLPLNIGVNVFTVTVAATLSVPGVTMLLLVGTFLE